MSLGNVQFECRAEAKTNQLNLQDFFDIFLFHLVIVYTKAVGLIVYMYEKTKKYVLHKNLKCFGFEV